MLLRTRSPKLFLSLVLVSLLGALSATSAHAAPRVYKVAVILYGFEDFSDYPISPDVVKEMTFTATGDDRLTGSVNSYFKEVTEDQITFRGHLDVTGDVFGWYTLPRSMRRRPRAGDSSPCRRGRFRHQQLQLRHLRIQHRAL